MSMKLYVGGLPYRCTEDEVKDHFSAAGSVVSVAIITDKMTGRSRGFGFVEMDTEDEGKKAIEMFNGTDFQGRKLTVNEARPLQNRDEKKSY
jgi:RNA recognition motif-containing protein